MRVRRVEVLGTPVDLVDLQGALAWIEERIARPLPHCVQVITTNPEAVVRAQAEPGLMRALWESELVTADGVGIVWAVARHDRPPAYRAGTGLGDSSRSLRTHGRAAEGLLSGGRPRGG